jgi:hypothetical protein
MERDKLLDILSDSAGNVNEIAFIIKGFDFF